jgi:DNA-binding NtrC family response regulator
LVYFRTAPPARGKVLIVEDDTDTAEVIHRILVDEQYHAHTCINRNDAMRELRRHSFDCILMDLRMEGMAIDTFMTELEMVSPHCKVILITAERRFDLSDLTFSGCLLKPSTPDEILRVVAACLE